MKSLFIPVFVVLTVIAQADLPVSIPKPLTPTFPKQDSVLGEEAMPMLVRGQDRTVDGLKNVLDEPLPIPKGTVENGIISTALTGSEDSEESTSIFWTMDPARNSAPKVPADQRTKSADDSLGHAALLAMTVIAMLCLAYMAFVAYDYRQRWLQSMMAQNDRCLGGGFDMESEDMYGSSFSEGFGLPRRSSI